MRKATGWIIGSLLLMGLNAPTLALEYSIGENGINADILHQPPYNLTGSKIAIGQVEIGRPGKFGWDKSAAWQPGLNLAKLFYRNEPAVSNSHVDHHAAMVAGIMVSNDKKLPGVAPRAKLYSSAVGSLKKGGQPEECMSAQHIAQQNSGDVRAINFSFGESLQRDARDHAKLDGNALLTQCIDWSARVHDVVYVVAGNQGSGGIPIPTDNYNGITTAYTAKREGKYTKVDFANLSSFPTGIGRSLIKQEINFGTRRAVSLLAPGNKIEVYNLDGKITEVTGTSFAAPHITGAVALLQEAGDRLLNTATPHWGLDSRRHEVMKAVLLNSADKLQDQGDGLLLGMNRTTLTKNNRTWLDSDAYQNDKIPLDMEMGTGHLNVFRAYQQFTAGQYQPNNFVANIGWNYNNLSVNSYQDYIWEQPLVKDSFAAVTLVWDRLVILNDLNNNQQYDVGETFSDRSLNNLDIYLMPFGSDNIAESICASKSDNDSIEHIFCPIPETGRYKIRVYYRQQLNEKNQSYALAWWTKKIND